MEMLRRIGGLPRLRAMALLALLCLPPVAAGAQDSAGNTGEPDFEALEQALERLDSRLERVRDAIDLTRFDADELVFEQAFDGEALVAFVNREIAFHPYEGLLRGVRGTLHSRAGNSLDQSLLLAYLLKTAGLDARVVRGELAPDQARSLLAATRRARPAGELEPAREAIRANFGDAALEQAEAVEIDKTATRRRAQDEAGRLLALLNAAGGLPDGAGVAEVLLAQTRDYFWVEHRGGPGEEWQAAHPAFGGDPGFAVEAREYMAERIDEKFHHRLTVEAFVRQRQLDSHKTHRIMKAFTRPVANLHGVTLSYRNHPGGLTPETLMNLEEALDEDQILTPVFMGSNAPGAMAFDLKGRTIDPMALGSEVGGAAGLFAELSDKMEAATGTLVDPDDPATVFALDAMWLEFTWTSPSGREATQRRYLLPPAGDETRSPAQILWPLISEYVYVVNVGDMPLEYVADRYLQAGRESLPVYRALAHKLMRPQAGTTLPDSDLPQDFGPLALYQIMARNPLADDEVVMVRHRPSLVGLRSGLRDANTAFAAVDVVFNHALQLRVDEQGVRHDPVSALRQGVWETASETLPGRLRGDDVLAQTSTFSVLERARADGIELALITPAEPDAVDSLVLEATSRALLREELENGYTVVVPKRSSKDTALSGWWRVDPATGVTLGMTADGHGQDVVEYLIEITGIAFNMVQAIGGLMKCEELTDNVEKMCCLVEAHVNNVGGLAFGSLLGATLGTAGAAVFDIVNFGMQEATGAALGADNSQGLMPTADLSCERLRGSGF